MLAIYMLDLDGFKPINDRHGHDTGDELLIAIGQRLQTQLRPTDLVARVGGDEFVVMVADLKTSALAQEIAEKLQSAFDAPFTLSAHTCGVGATVGYVIAPTDGRNATDLLRIADLAMYAGKQSGKGRITHGTALVC